MPRLDANLDLPPEVEPAGILAWSELRLDAAAKGRVAFMLWRPRGYCAAIGVGQSPERELDVEAMRRDGVGLVRRQSGGGAVLLYPGVLCWEAWGSVAEIAARGGDGGIRDSYAVLSRPILTGLRAMGVPARPAGVCDVSVEADGRLVKLAGLAQLRRRDRVLVHGSLLVAPDLGVMARYLRHPGDEPDYRKGRSHREFCLTVAEALGTEGRDAAEVFAATAGAVATAAAAMGWEIVSPPGGYGAEAERLAREKYRSPGWNWERRRPAAGRETSVTEPQGH